MWLLGVLKQCARLCLKLGLIEGNTLFIDSTKIRGNASLKATWTKERCEQEVLWAKVKEVVAELEAGGAKSLNMTDRECTRIHGLQGSHAGYLTELVVDEREGRSTRHPGRRAVRGK